MIQTTDTETTARYTYPSNRKTAHTRRLEPVYIIGDVMQE
jgi:hypothetical protein